MRARSARRVAATAALALLGGALSAGAGAIATDEPVAATSIRDREYWLDEYGIRGAWAATRGAGVTIAIIDSGVDASHPDLGGVVVGGTDVSGIGSPDGTQPVGIGSDHGTRVASLAAGRGLGPGGGVLGAAPDANLLTVSLAFGVEAARSGDDQIAEAVRWSVDQGADIISLSLTRNTVEWPESWDDAFGYAEANDVVVIAAAGNRGSGTEQVGAPATMPGVLVVGGVNRQGVASDRASSQGITIGVMAPSEQLVGAVPGGGYVIWQGTSGATPIVAGIAALVRAAYPELDAPNVIQRILATARPVTDRVPDPIYGFGLVDARGAVFADVPRVDANPLGTIAEWVVVNRRADGSLPSLTGRDARAPIARTVPVDVTVAALEGAWRLSAPRLPVVLLAGITGLTGIAGLALLTAGFVSRARRQ
ncbi:S8 family peptidase [Microcella alkaliphila]|uniref:Serine protease n=1 Tax=Microcella alkaliphila TaxID=279828 RepID=A0A0U5BBT9_9MICO|nr:S8 family serine peptidase [Microcella alkaliphila]BAU31711.1 serine protease [Microcella alkaliphila]